MSDKELLKGIVLRAAPAPAGISGHERLSPKFTQYFEKVGKNYKLIQSTTKKDSIVYFLVERNEPTFNKSRCFIGKITLDAQKHWKTYQEIAYTPMYGSTEAIEKGTFLFKRLVKNGKLTSELTLNQYVEWPNEFLIYDSQNMLWVNKFK